MDTIANSGKRAQDLADQAAERIQSNIASAMGRTGHIKSQASPTGLAHLNPSPGGAAAVPHVPWATS